DAQQTTIIPVYSDEPVRLPGYRPERHPSQSDYAKAAEMIAEAKKPLIFCGHGVVKSEATDVLINFAERTDIPIAETLLGLGGFAASHALILGMMGMDGEAWANQAIQEAELLIAVGMRFDDRVTGNHASYAAHAKKIHVELDPAEINKIVRVDLPLIGNARDVLQNL